MFKKKFGITSLILCIVLIISACSNSPTASTNTSTSESTTATSNTQATETATEDSTENQTATDTQQGPPQGQMGQQPEVVSHYPEVISSFEQFEYTDPSTGNTIPYNLYLPSDYDESKTYPLVIFIADASVNSNTVTDPLKQDGAAVWATAEEQAKHEAIVLVPQYTQSLIDSIGSLTEDDHQWSEGLTLVSNLIFDVIDNYSVDENKVYGTGQSQGCMSTIAISDKYPDLYAAQLLVAGQWDTEEMSVMKDDNLWIVVCEGDTKAYPGMNEAIANWESLGATVAKSDMWDSTVSAEAFDQLVDATLSQNTNIHYTVFEGGNHMYTWTVAYTIEGLRDWLFSQTK